MAKQPTDLPGADNMPGKDDKKAEGGSKDYVCYTGCSVNLGLPNGGDEGEQPKRAFIKEGETVNTAMQNKLGGKNVRNLIAMGRLVEADSPEAAYIKEKVAKIGGQNTTEAKEGQTR